MFRAKLAPVVAGMRITWLTMKLLYQVDRRSFVVSLLTSVVQALFYPLSLLLIWRFLALVVNSGQMHQSFAQSIFFVLFLFILLVIQRVISTVNDTASDLLRTRSALYLQARMMEKMSEIPFPLFEDNSFQAQYSMVLGQSSYRPVQLVQTLFSCITSICAFLSVLLTLLFIASFLIILILVAILLSAVEMHFRLQSVVFQTSAAPDQFRMQFLSQRSIDATWQRDLRVYRSHIIQEEYQETSQRYLANFKKLLQGFLGKRIGVGIIVAVAIAGAIGIILWLLSNGLISTLQVGVLLPALLMCLQSGMALSVAAGELTECLGYIQKAFDFLQHSFQDIAVVPIPDQPVSDIDHAQIQLQQVDFSYPHAEKKALSQISYTFPVGITAIVGPNGAGKSTLVKVLTGLLQPVAGTLQVQVPVVADVPLRSVLFQEPSHFYLTIRQNVTFRLQRDPADDERIFHVLEQVGLLEVVQKLPDGIDTLVGAGFGGRIDLSGGQWQRLAVARLLYHDSPVIILDEPVASLDPQGERSIFEMMAQFAQSKIIIFTTHRYDSIPDAADILVLVDGVITESGRHDDLLRAEKQYWSLYTKSSAYNHKK